MVCPYRKLLIKSDQPVSTPEKNMIYYITEKEMFPECQGEACPFYVKSKAHDFERCLKAGNEIK